MKAIYWSVMVKPLCFDGILSALESIPLNVNHEKYNQGAGRNLYEDLRVLSLLMDDSLNNWTVRPTSFSELWRRLVHMKLFCKISSSKTFFNTCLSRNLESFCKNVNFFALVLSHLYRRDYGGWGRGHLPLLFPELNKKMKTERREARPERLRGNF